MIKKNLLTIIILTTLTFVVQAQTKKLKVKDPTLKNTWEVISVLKTNIELREGSYQRFDDGKLSVEGAYKNGEKVGVWKAYNWDNKVELEINYDNTSIKYLTIDTVSKTDVWIETNLKPTLDRPILNLTSTRMVFNYLFHLIEYPQDATENGVSGKVIIAVKVNKQGNVIGYSVKASVAKSIDKESIRVIKMMPFEFLPEYKNGVAIDSEFIIPVYFRLQG